MSSQKAKDHYLGKGGASKLNCAQAVLQSFAEHFKLEPKTIKEFSAHGGGNAQQLKS